MQEKHIRELTFLKKIIPNSLLGNVYWVVILLVCRRWEGKESSSPKQEDTAQVRSSGRVPAAQETEVERSQDKPAQCSEAPYLAPKNAVSPSSWPNDQALGEKRPF